MRMLTLSVNIRKKAVFHNDASRIIPKIPVAQRRKGLAVRQWQRAVKPLQTIAAMPLACLTAIKQSGFALKAKPEKRLPGQNLRRVASRCTLVQR